MKVLVINGSPKGDLSNSLCMTKAFVEGLGACELRELTVARMNISHCRGCFGCWKHTPGKCVLKDDMAEVIEAELWADVIIWSFPLYYFNVPGLLKNLIDRQLPMMLPFMEENTHGTGSGSHPVRYDCMLKKRHVLISTCGFYSKEGNYDSVLSMFDHVCPGYETIFCGQGEIFRVPETQQRAGEYLEIVKRAGSEFAKGEISEETKEALDELLYPKEIFEEWADAEWCVDKETGEKTDETMKFVMRMAALYDPRSYGGEDRVLELCFTDLRKTYQILLGRDGSKVFADGSLEGTTRIDTPWEVWYDISIGKRSGEEALMQGLYRVSGDITLMMKWHEVFGAAKKRTKEKAAKTAGASAKPPKMSTMLTAWITFWVAVSMDAVGGGAVSLLACAFLPFLFQKRMLNLYDRLSFLMVTCLSLLAILTGDGKTAFLLGYFGFGVLWLGSCFTKEPLCAAYVKYDYGGEEALRNKIFMRTNYILAAMWGIGYILLTGSSYLLWQLHWNPTVVALFNNLPTAWMGMFTLWFSRWYPKRVLLGKKTRLFGFEL